MPDTPFWKQDAPEGDTAPQTDAPTSLDDVITVGERKFVRAKGVSANVNFTDDDGRPLGTIHVPYDPDNQPSEDDVLAKANQLYHDLQHMRSLVRDDVVTSLAQSFIQSGVSETIIKAATDTLRGAFRVYLTDDERASKTPEHLAEWETIAREAERIYDEKVLEAGIRAAVSAREHEGAIIGEFWLNYARDLIAHALIWARDEIADNLGGPEALETLKDDEYERMLLDAYKTGPYLTQAMLTLWQPWTKTLVEIAAANSRIANNDPETAGSFNALIRAARKSLGLPEEPPGTPSPPVLTPAFDADGYGRIKKRHDFSRGAPDAVGPSIALEYRRRSVARVHA